MSGSPYASALGRLKAYLPEFLGPDTYRRLLSARELSDIAKILEGSPYGAEIVRASATNQGADLLQLGINRTFVARNRRALESASFAGRPIIGTYLGRWDIENITVVLGGMVLGRPVQETELGLVSWRELPAGVAAGALTFDDLRALIGQPTVEAAVNFLVKFGYGPVLLPLVEEFVRTRDVFALTQALERDYYKRLLASLRYFQGDEWVVREFLKAEIDERNVELLLKAKDAELASEEVSARWTEGGMLGASSIPDLYQARSVPELVTALASRYPILQEGLPAYQGSKSLTGFESALLRDRIVREVRRMRAYPLSLSILTTYLLRGEAERADLRRIVYGKVYGVPETQVEPFLVSPRIG